jgi:hypothetical protein
MHDQLKRLGHEVVDVTTSLATPEDSVSAGHALADAWSSRRPDAAIAVGPGAGLAAHVAAREAGVPVALRLIRPGRGSDDERTRLEIALARTSAVVLVRSTVELAVLTEHRVSRDHVRVLPEAVDLARFADDGPDPDDAGRDTVLVAGAGTGTEREDLAAALEPLPGHRVEVLGAATAEVDVARHLRTAALVVVADDTDAEVTLLLRAMACGVPAVTTDVGALADVVADRVTGLVVPSPVDLAPAARALLADDLARSGMGLAAVDRVRARFGTETVGAELERQLAALVKGPEQVVTG